MTIAELQSWFWKAVGLPSTAYIASGKITAAEVDDLIWEGIREFCQIAEPVHLHRRSDYTFTSGQEVKTYPTDFWRFRRGERCLVNGLPVDRRSESYIYKLKDGNYPLPDSVQTMFIYDAGVEQDSGEANFGLRKFGIYPASASTITLRMFYLREPMRLDHTGLSGGSEYPDLPAWYHRDAVYLAADRFYKNNPDAPAKDISRWVQDAQSRARALYTEVNEEWQGDQMGTIDAGFLAELDSIYPTEYAG